MFYSKYALGRSAYGQKTGPPVRPEGLDGIKPEIPLKKRD